MKLTWFAMLAVLGLKSASLAYELKEYSYKVSDLSELGVTKEQLFSELDRDWIKLSRSVCANRAHMWAYDMKVRRKVDSAKIFLFYTGKTGKVGKKTWWYHVAPVVAEKNSLYVLDAGFRGDIEGPLSVPKWLERFTGTQKCYEMKLSDADLIERMFLGQVFPTETQRGAYDCYFMLTPEGYWIPHSVALNALKRDEQGASIEFERKQIDEDEVYTACVEAVTGPVSRVLGFGREKCKKYLGLKTTR